MLVWYKATLDQISDITEYLPKKKSESAITFPHNLPSHIQVYPGQLFELTEDSILRQIFRGKGDENTPMKCEANHYE